MTLNATDIMQTIPVSPELRKISKILFLGDSGVGKTSLARRFTNSGFNTKYNMTICCNIFSREISGTQSPSEFFIINDIAGQSRFKDIRSIFYFNFESVFAVCDLTRKQTLENLENVWIPEIILKSDIGRYKKINVVLIGNKLDLDDLHVITSDDLRETLLRIESQYPNITFKTPILLTSAKENMSIELFIDSKETNNLKNNIFN